MNGPLLSEQTTKTGRWTRSYYPPEVLDNVGARSLPRYLVKIFTVVQEQNPELRLAQAHRIIQDRIEHRREIVRRSAYHAQDLRRCSLLFESFSQVASTFLYFPFQSRIRVLETLGHAVELVGQRLQFVTASYFNTMIERSRANAGSARTQHLDRRHHPAHKIQTCRS